MDFIANFFHGQELWFTVGLFIIFAVAALLFVLNFIDLLKFRDDKEDAATLDGAALAGFRMRKARFRTVLYGVTVSTCAIVWVGMLGPKPVDPGPSVGKDGAFQQNLKAPKEKTLKVLKKDAQKRVPKVLREVANTVKEESEVDRILKNSYKKAPTAPKTTPPTTRPIK